MKAKEIYNYIYSHAIPGKALYGAFGRRDGFFVDFIRRNVSKGSTVFDASCGRGFLMRWLIADEYRVKGSEIATWLMEPGGDLYGLDVVELSYGDLGKIGKKSFDVVVSNDVLEHLETEDDVVRAVKRLSQITKRWFLMSTGGIKAARCPFPVELGISNLHNIIRPYEWWEDLYTSFCRLEESFEAAGSHFFFGEVI